MSTVSGRTEAVTVPVGHFGWLTAGRASVIAWACWLVGMVSRLALVWLVARFGDDARQTAFGTPASYLVGAVAGTTISTVGALIVARRPLNTIGWLWVIGGLLQGLTGLGTVYASVATVSGVTQPAVLAAWIASIALQATPLAVVALTLSLFPDGHVLSRGWRIGAWLAVVGCVIRILEVGFGANVIVGVPSLDNPYQLEGMIGDLLARSADLRLGLAIETLAVVFGAISIVLRYQRGNRDLRRQIAWVAAAGAVVIVAAIPFVVLTLTRPPTDPPGPLPLILLFAAINLPPIAALIAITRYRLYEIDRIVNRAVLYGALTALLTGLFAGLVTFSERLVEGILGVTSDVTVVLSAVVVAIAYQPLRDRLETMVDRRFRYERARFGPYASQLSTILDAIDPPAAARRLLGEAVGQLGAVGGVVTLEPAYERAGESLSLGTWSDDATIVRVEIGDERHKVGTLLLAGRSDGSPYEEAEIAELRSLARQVARAIPPRRSSS